MRYDPAMSDETPRRLPRVFTVPIGCAVVATLGLIFTLAFTLGNLYTLKALTNPYINSSALVKGFFARLSQGAVNAQKERYIHAYVTVAGLTYEEATGWLIFGKPAAISGRITNSGDRVIDGVDLELDFVDPTGQIVAGGTVILPDILKPNETVPFRISQRDAGFDFPANAKSLHRIYRIKELHFYEPPRRSD